MRTEIRLAGFGGQGVVLAGAILGEAAVNAGLEAVQTQSFGPEARGGTARSEVVLSDEAVHYPCVTSPDVLVLLSEEAAVRYGSDVRAGTHVVVDDDLVRTGPDGAERVPFSGTAVGLGNRVVTNIVMLGYIARRFDLVPRQAVEAAVARNVPRGSEDLNVRALGAGWAMAEARSSGEGGA